MKEVLISFETAMLAKNKGFDWETYHCYFTTSSDPSWNPIGQIRPYPTKHNWNDGEWGKNGGSNPASAPTQSVLQKWLREIHKIHITPHFHREGYFFNIEDSRGKYGIQMTVSTIMTNTYYQSYEEALEQGLIEALKLI